MKHQLHQGTPSGPVSNKSGKRTPIAAQSQSSQSTTFDRLQNLKPLRETNNMQRQTPLSHNQNRQKTPVPSNKNDIRESKSNLKQSNNNLENKGQSTQRLKENKKNNVIQGVVDLDIYASIDGNYNPMAATSLKYNSNQRDEDFQKYLGQTLDKRDKSSTPLGRHQNNATVSVYVVKNKKSQQAQSMYKQQFLSKTQTNLANCESSSNLRQSQKDIKLTSKKDRTPKQADDLSSIRSSRQSDSKNNKYSGVQSKVRQNLRSKTPKSKGAILTPQQQMDQNEKQLRRQREICDLENNLCQIQHDLEFKQNNKDLIFDTYKSNRKSQTRKNTDISQLGSSDNGDTERVSTSTSSQKVVLQSKKQFSQFELQLNNHKFNDKYFDKVYLELCGYGDAGVGKSALLEKERSMATVRKYVPFLTQSQPHAEMQGESQDVVGSVTFFESRAQRPREERNHYETLLPEPANELDEIDYSKIVPIQESQIRNRGYEYQVEDSVNKFISFNNVDDDVYGQEDNKKRMGELRLQNQQLEEDFENVFQDLVNQRKTASHMAFYEAINEYDYDKKQLDNAVYKDPNGSFQVATSPTKRLICMKNSSIEHYRHIRERNLINREPDQKNMIYMASPERSYVVKADQKIDYTLAFKKNPAKFYEEALNAPIVKHRILHQSQGISPKNGNVHTKKSTLGSQSSCSVSQKDLKQTINNVANNLLSGSKKSKKDHDIYTISSKQTTRPHNRINQKIKSKIEQKLADKLGSQLTQQVLKALEDANLHEAINDIISQHSGQADDDYRPIHKSGEVKMSKAMSVKSLQVNKQFEDIQRDEVESTKGDEKNYKQLLHHSNKKETSSVRNPVTRELKTTSNIANDQTDKTGKSVVASRRSGASSRQYVSEQGLNLEEDVKVNRAYQ
ncbi:UNKNOWN [Stylonychia lemnae]|uniref:Uncharacterized protein n=1 Tax=Stylonychia lemnae TaxID=5949 RepID=A0A077ZQ38_STYLE|nr:UNKNOWN [Stylonychia lemnae]|eukprot:CDW71495.1 UNKNOWN [Stylonychia lemnae]